MTKQIVFIHGAWLNSRSWENFSGYFENLGYTCSTPEWPYRDPNKTAAELRESTPPELAQIGLKELTDHYDAIIRAMPEQPILIGHSFGGLITQQLLDRGLGSAGVTLDSAAPEGVLALDWDVLRSNTASLLAWMGWDRVVHMNFSQFQFSFVNTFPEQQQRECYDNYCVPETGRIFFQAAFAQLDPHHALHVNFKNNDRAPLLMIAGELDHIVPAHVAHSNYEKYQQSTAQTYYREFAGRAHLIGAQDGWEEVAGYIGEWLAEIQQQAPSSPALATEPAS